MATPDRSGDQSSRDRQHQNDDTPAPPDMGETGQQDGAMRKVAGAHGEGAERNDVTEGNRSVGNNTDGVVGSSGEPLRDRMPD